MKKYLPNNSELRVAIFTAIATILLVLVGGWLVRAVWWASMGTFGSGYGMDSRMGNMMGGKGMGMMKKMGGVHQMPDGSMMMNDNEEMDMMDMTMNDMVDMLDGKTGKALEKEFIVGMIPHHQGAVDMAKVLLQDKTISPEMKKFAEQIVTAQEGEIKMMNEWLKKY